MILAILVIVVGIVLLLHGAQDVFYGTDRSKTAAELLVGTILLVIGGRLL